MINRSIQVTNTVLTMFEVKMLAKFIWVLAFLGVFISFSFKVAAYLHSSTLFHSDSDPIQLLHSSYAPPMEFVWWKAFFTSNCFP